MFGAIDNTKKGSYTRDDFRKVLESQGFLCFYCGSPIVEKSLDRDKEATPDHLLAESRGGVDFIWNIVAACAQCNRLKLAKLPGEFLRERWSLAQLVDPKAHKFTTIPFSKERLTLPNPDELDDDGNLVTAHLEVSPFTAGVIRQLATTTRMDNAYADQMRDRRALLLQQAASMNRRLLESSGQIPLVFDKPKPVASELLETEAQTLAVAKGMHVVDGGRRQA